MDYSDLTTAELREACDGIRAELGRREAEEAARAAVDEAVRAYANSQGFTVLQAWRVLAPEAAGEPDPAPEPTPDAPDFVQPTGAHDAYKRGALVTYRGRVYRSRIDHNAYSPAAYPQGWEEVS